MKSQLTVQKKELEAAAAASLEKAEEAFTKQLAEMQTLLADYQTQVGKQAEREAIVFGFFLRGGPCGSTCGSTGVLLVRLNALLLA